MTRLEMDDVLSSIRKLVSETPRQHDGLAEEASLFVLTPAHRVEPPAAAPETLQAAPNQGVPEAFEAEPPVPPAPPVDEAPVDESPVADEAPVDAAPEFAAGTAEPVAFADPPEAEAQEPAEAETPARPDLSSDPIDLKSRIARLEQAVGRTDEQFEPDGSEPQDAEMPELHFLEQYRRRFTPMPADLRKPPEPEEPRGEDEPLQLGDVAIFTHRPRPGEARADQDDAAQAEAPVEGPAEPAGTVEDPTPEVDMSGMVADLIEEAGAEPVAPEPGPDVEPEPEVEPEPVAGASGPEMAFSHRRAPEAVEEVVEPTDVVAEVAGAAEAAAEAAAPDLDAAPQAAAGDAGAGEMAANDAPAEEAAASEVVELFDEAGGEVWDREDEMLVDEAMLRKIVADIVRDELQGRLGERITRNVRRMVRREIEKAIAIKSIE